jgi:maleate cis-trans isomerase
MAKKIGSQNIMGITPRIRPLHRRRAAQLRRKRYEVVKSTLIELTPN